MKKLLIRYLLIISIIFLSVSGLFGGIALIIDPSGSIINLPIWFLDNTIFPNYLIPGVILFLTIGVLPGFTAFGLITGKHFSFAHKINIYRNRHWSWTYSLYSGIILILWIDFQIMLIGYGHYIQIAYAFIGVLNIILALIPSNMRYYRIKRVVIKKRKKK